jgi:hypothetical protein
MCGRPVHKGAWCKLHRAIVYKPDSTRKVTQCTPMTSARYGQRR